MKKEIADLWIADLRSGPPQTEGRLSDGKGYCCLGRLCVIAGLAWDQDRNSFYTKGRYENSYLPEQVREWAGMISRKGAYQVGDSTASLSSMNDAGMTFPEIADVIAKHWEFL